MTTDSKVFLGSIQTFLNVSELAALLRVSKTSIYRLVERRLIPFHRLPRGLRFNRQDIETFLLNTHVDSVDKNTYERQKD